MAVGYNAFEFFLEFGQVATDPPEPHVHTRIVTAPAIAKGFFRSLTQSLAEYETTYGPAGGQTLEGGEDFEGTQS